MKIIKSKIGDLFCMTIGDWDRDYKEYRIRGNAYIPLSEIVGLQRTVFYKGDPVVCRVKLKTAVGLGINGVSSLFQIPVEEWDELLAYITDGEAK